MRKIITCSAIILLFTMLSGMAFAGTYPECDEFKQGPVKGLFGLCVAYQNADADGKEDIFDNWMKKVGVDGPKLPNAPYPDDPPPPASEADFLCPCWDELEFADICNLGAPVGSLISKVNDLPVAGYVDFVDPVDGSPNSFGTNGVECTHLYFDPTLGDSGGFVFDNNDGFPLVFDEDLGIDEPSACLTEVELINELHQDVLCAP